MRILLSDSIEEKVIDSFRKLQDYVYFENTDLYLRNQLTDFLNNNGLSRVNSLLQDIRNKEFQEELLNQITLRCYPKKISNDIDGLQNVIPHNFITNVLNERGCKIERLTIFCDIPIELHIISILWILNYGYNLEEQLDKNSLGNRLILYKNKLLSGRALFKPYIKQYHKWWSDGIETAKRILNNKDDVTIINFDLKDYFHAVQCDFDKLEKELLIDIFNDSYGVHELFKKIHEKYASRLEELGVSAFNRKEKSYPLPIGLLSSFVLANWHLKGLDQFIQSRYNPDYYGRYVDDFLIVIKDRILRVNEGNENLIDLFMSRYFKDLFNVTTISDQKNYSVNFQGLDNLMLQKDKIFIYQFDHKYSPNLLSKFIEEQKERSSEFRFLSDQEDDGFGDFEENVFEDNFESEDLNKAKFKKLEENRFKISAYLAKLIQRIIERGYGYKSDEVDKIEKYFKGSHSIKFYFFWEKLFTLYLVSNRHELFKDLMITISKQLALVKFGKDLALSNEKIVEDLKNHLRNSMEMALGLDPSFFRRDVEEVANEFVGLIEPMKFRRVGLLRKQYIYYPLLQLSKKAKLERFSLLNKNILSQFKWYSSDFEILDMEFIPYRVKFYECSIYFHNKTFYSIDARDANMRRYIENVIPTKEVLEQTFDMFYSINNPMNLLNREEVRNEYFEIFKIDSQFDDIVTNELFFKNSGKNKDEYRIGIVNKYVSINTIKASLDGDPIVNSERVETFSFILDQASKVKDLDVFVMPEVSLPYALIKKFARFSVDNQTAFVTGIEHLRINDIAINLILTCIPINVDGDRDAIPVFRVKNHYSPEEEELIWEKRMVPLKPKKYTYDLFEWRGLYFSSYYCFELADIYHRTLFYSKIDLICASVWNPDTHYYSNIVESTTRDMHCYFVQVNTSQYGDSRITRPTDHVRKDKAKVTGGTVSDYKVNLLVSDISVTKLRKFQQLDYSGQRKDINGKRPFKPTPPDYPVQNVLIRERNQRFGGAFNDLPF